MNKTNHSPSSGTKTLEPLPSSRLLLGHTGDWHLRPSQFSRKVRGPHFFQGGLDSLEKAYKEGIKYVLNAGDILDRNRQRTCNIRELMAIDAFLKDHWMTMYTITGNHDLDTPTWLETLFGGNGEGPGIVPLDNKILRIPGTAYTVGNIATHDVKELLTQLKSRKPEELPDIMVWHGGVDGFMGFSAYKVTYQELLDAAPGIKLFALADLHLNAYYEKEGRVIGYPGSTEMCSISEDPIKKLAVLELADGVCRHTKNLALDTTPVFKISFTTADDALELGNWKKLVAAEEFSLIHLIYTQEYAETARAFSSQIDEARTVIRRKRLSEFTSKVTGTFDFSNSIKEPAELLPNFAQPEDKFYPFLTKLSTRLHDPRIVVEQLIQEHAPEGLRSL